MKKIDSHLIAEKMAEDIIKNVVNKENRLRKNYFIVLVGIPGGGKTTLSFKLERKFNFLKVSTDKIKEYLVKNKKEFSLNDLFFIQKEIFKIFMRNKINIISDSNSDSVKYRSRLKKLARNFGYTPIVIYIKVDLDKAYERIIKRKNIKYSKKIYQKLVKFKRSLQAPKKAYVINGNLNKKEFLNEVNKINFDQ